MTIEQTPYTGGLTQNNHLLEMFNQTFTDQFLYGNATVITYIDENGDPTLERVDPYTIVYGQGLESQIESSNNRYYTSLSIGTSSMNNIQQSIYDYTNTLPYEKDIYKNNIKVNMRSSDYKSFDIIVMKDSCEIIFTTNKGDMRQYNLLMKNAKRGVYMNIKDNKWKYEFK